MTVRVYECGICECLHREQFDGDCRDDSERFDGHDDILERLHISDDDIEYVPMPGTTGFTIHNQLDRSNR